MSTWTSPQTRYLKLCWVLRCTFGQWSAAGGEGGFTFPQKSTYLNLVDEWFLDWFFFMLSVTLGYKVMILMSTTKNNNKKSLVFCRFATACLTTLGRGGYLDNLSIYLDNRIILCSFVLFSRVCTLKMPDESFSGVNSAVLATLDNLKLLVWSLIIDQPNFTLRCIVLVV